MEVTGSIRLDNNVSSDDETVNLKQHVKFRIHVFFFESANLKAQQIFAYTLMDEWVSRQHTLLVVAQETQLQNDQHKVVENDAANTDYPIMCYIHLQRVVVISYFPNIEDHIKLEDGSSPYTSLKI